MGIAGIQRTKAARERYATEELRSIEKKAKYNAAKQKTKQKAERAEFKTYVKEMGKTGLRDSYTDTTSGGRSTRIYNDIRTRKGKEYADRVEKRVQNVAYAKIAASSAVAIGSYAVTIATLKD